MNFKLGVNVVPRAWDIWQINNNNIKYKRKGEGLYVGFCWWNIRQGVHGPWKSSKVPELEKNIPGLESPWKSVEVLESPGINFLNLQLCQLEVCIGSDWTFMIRQLRNV